MSQKRRPLYDRLRAFQEDRPISFHVPGHKNGLLWRGIDSKFADFLAYDLTELSGLDDLHAPEGVIAEAQQLLSELYQTKKSYFLVNGSTVGNLAMILATCNEGDRVLVQRNCHKSILNALLLARLQPLFISPQLDERTGMSSMISEDLVQYAFEEFPDIKACIFTYPDYYGHTFALEKISAIAHNNEALVLIDEAHGPHFRLGHPFPASALDLGADIVVHSAHKILPAMTMGSYLHINSDRVSESKVEYYLSLLQSSSPSYPIMASLDLARSYLADFSQADCDYTLETTRRFASELRQLPGITVTLGDDPLKMMVNHEKMSGYELQEKLESVGVFAELSLPSQVLLILPLLKEAAEFPYMQAIQRLGTLDWRAKEVHSPLSVQEHEEEVSGLTQLSYVDGPELLEQPIEWVPIKDAAGRIAARMLIPYPPGIPLFLPGERITAEQIVKLGHLLEGETHFQGATDKLADGKVAVFLSTSS